MSRTYVGVDPGGTTGLAIWRSHVGLSLREIKGADEARDWLGEMAHAMKRATFVVERYIITPQSAKKSQQHDALEIIGALKYVARLRGHEVILQSPSEAKAFSTDEKLQRIGWYKPGQPHARDASRHLLLMLAKDGIIDLNTLRGDPNDAHLHL